MSAYGYLSLTLGLLLTLPSPPLAAWEVVSQADSSSNIQTRIAHAENNEGYTLDIYRDSVGAIRARFSLNRPLDKLPARHCPTFQVDDRVLDNRSVNDAPCINDADWSEFVLGYVNAKEVISPKLYALVNGKTLTYRFMLEHGGYDETSFSLNGSKRSTLTVLGGNVSIIPR